MQRTSPNRRVDRAMRPWVLAGTMVLAVVATGCGSDDGAETAPDTVDSTPVESTAPPEPAPEPVTTTSPPSEVATSEPPAATNPSSTAAVAPADSTIAPAAPIDTVPTLLPSELSETECVALERAYVAFTVAQDGTIMEPAVAQGRLTFFVSAAETANENVDEPELGLGVMEDLAGGLDDLLPRFDYDFNEIPESDELEALQLLAEQVGSITVPAVTETIPVRCGTPIADLSDLALETLAVINAGGDPMTIPMPSES